MSEKDILQRIKKSIDSAEIDILDDIKAAPKTKMIKHDDITRQESFYDKFKKVIPYTSVAIIFLVAFLGLQIQWRTPDSLVYLDVNPSVNFTTNKQDKVIRVEADNEDGRRIIDQIDFKGKSIEEVTEELLDRMIEEDYLVNNYNYVLLSVYNKDNEKGELQRGNLDRLIHKHLRENNIRPIVLGQKLNKTDMIKKIADKHGISDSKMTFIKRLIDLNPALKEEDLAKLSLAELVELINENDIKIDKIIETNDIKRIEKQKKYQIDKQKNYRYDSDEDDDDDDDEDDDNEDEKDEKKDKDYKEKPKDKYKKDDDYDGEDKDGDDEEDDEDDKKERKEKERKEKEKKKIDKIKDKREKEEKEKEQKQDDNDENEEDNGDKDDDEDEDDDD